MDSVVVTILCVLISILQCVRTDISTFWITECDSANRTKSCFRHPSDCVRFSEDVNDDDKSCNFLVTWQQTFDQNSVNFEVYAPVTNEDKEYVAVAFSDNSKMAHSDVLACMKNEGTVRVVHYWNGDGHVNEGPEELVGVSPVTGAITDGVLNCNFKRVKHIEGQSHFKDLRNDLYMLVSRGLTLNGEIAYHVNGKYVSSARHNYGLYTADPDPTTHSLTSDITYRTPSKHGQGPCSSMPCKNSGECSPTSNGFICTCGNRYRGERCETDTGSSNVISASLVTLLLTTLATCILSL